jgi:AsmA family protein
MADRRLSRRRVAAAAAGVLLFAGLWLAAAHATWARPLLQRYVLQHAARAIDFERLELGFSGDFEPTVTFHGLVIENAPWAAKRPLVTAGVLRFVFSWQTLRGDKYVVQKLEMADAKVDLERQADGLRNWRLGHPDDRGPGRVRVLSVDAQRSELRFVHGGVGLDVDMHMSPLDAPQSLPSHAGLPLTKRFEFAGTRDGKAFSGEAAVSDLLSFADTGLPFALRGTARSAASRLAVEGVATDIQQFAALDVQLQLTSPRLSELSVALPFSLPSAPTDFSAQTHLTKRAGTWTVAGLRATLGSTDLRGDAMIEDRRHASASGQAEASAASAPANKAATRPLLRATLASDAVHSADLAAFATGGSGPRHVDGQGLFALDGEVDLHVGRIVLPATAAGKLLPASDLRTHVSLEDGRLVVAPFGVDLIGGHLGGEARADAQVRPPAVALDLKLTNLRAERVGQTLAGGIDGRLALRAQGDSVAALASTLSGSATLTLAKATIPKRLDARLALDGVAILGTLFGDAQERVPVLCGVLAVDVHAGRVTARRMALETERVTLDGSGTADLAPATLDVLLTPALKQRALLALDRSIHISGPISAPSVRLVAPAPQRSEAAGCTTVRNPLTPVVAATQTPRDTRRQSPEMHLSRLDATPSLPAPEKP